MEYKYSDHELELLAKVDELQKEKSGQQKDRRDHRNYRRYFITAPQWKI